METATITMATTKTPTKPRISPVRMQRRLCWWFLLSTGAVSFAFTSPSRHAQRIGLVSSSSREVPSCKAAKQSHRTTIDRHDHDDDHDDGDGGGDYFGGLARRMQVQLQPQKQAPAPRGVWKPKAVAAAAASVAASLAVSTGLLLQPVPVAQASAPPTLNEAIVALSETSYPILRALDPINFKAFSSKIGDLVLQQIRPDKLGKSIELGMEVLDSAPPEDMMEFNAILQDAYASVKVDSCQPVPLPPKSLVGKVSSLAKEGVDPDTLATFATTWKASWETLQKVSPDDESICLPANRAALDKLALAQANLARSFGKAETKAFVSYTGPLLKAGISPTKAVALVEDAKTVAPTATPQQKKDFAAAGRQAEAASKLEIARNKIAEKKAQQAANRAAVAASKQQ